MKHLWEIEHPYRCNEADYFKPNCHFYYAGARDFLAHFGGNDADLNYVVRWDWRDDHFYVFHVVQRKGFLQSGQFPVTEADEPMLRAWLETRWQTVLANWSPVSSIPLAESEQRGDRCAYVYGPTTFCTRAKESKSHDRGSAAFLHAFVPPVSPMPPLGDAAGSEDADLKALIVEARVEANNVRASRPGLSAVLDRLANTLEARESTQRYPLKATPEMLRAWREVYFSGLHHNAPLAALDAALSAAPRESPLPSPADTEQCADCGKTFIENDEHLYGKAPGYHRFQRTAGPAPSVEPPKPEPGCPTCAGSREHPMPRFASKPDDKGYYQSSACTDAFHTPATVAPSPVDVERCAYVYPAVGHWNDGQRCNVRRNEHIKFQHEFTPPGSATYLLAKLREARAVYAACPWGSSVSRLAEAVDAVLARFAAGSLDAMVSAADAFEACAGVPGDNRDRAIQGSDAHKERRL